MQTHTNERRGAAFLAIAAMAALFAGLAFAPSAEAQGYWWNDDDTSTVTILKYVDGEPATAESADGHSFPMTSSWDDPENGGEGSGSYELSASTSPAYAAVTSELHDGASYTTSEVTDGDVVGASCEDGTPFALAGYTTGSSQSKAEAAEMSSEAPSFDSIWKDQYVIVWNESCDDEPEEPTDPSTGSLNGEVTGGATDPEPGDLEVTGIEAEKTTAVANGEFEDGWRYVFSITVPEDETDLAMKFSDWEQTDGDHTIPVANNMRISSAQASSTDPVLLTAADTYSSPDLTMTGDLDAGEPGLQVEVVVEVAVPSGTYNGAYSTTYGVRTI